MGLTDILGRVARMPSDDRGCPPVLMGSWSGVERAGQMKECRPIVGLPQRRPLTVNHAPGGVEDSQGRLSFFCRTLCRE